MSRRRPSLVTFTERLKDEAEAPEEEAPTDVESKAPQESSPPPKKGKRRRGRPRAKRTRRPNGWIEGGRQIGNGGLCTVLASTECVIDYRTANASILMKLWELLCPILVDGLLFCRPDGIVIKGLGQHHFVHIWLPRALVDLCYIYNGRPVHDGIEERDEVVIGVNFARLYDCCKGSGQKDSMYLQLHKGYEEEPFPYLNLFIRSGGEQDKADIISQNSIPLLDMEEVIFDVPGHYFAMSVTVGSRTFQRVVNKHMQCGATMEIHASVSADQKTKTVYFVTTGLQNTKITSLSYQVDPKEKVNEVCDAETGIKGSRNVNCSMKSVVDLAALNLMCKATPMSRDVQIYLDPDYPYVFRYFVGPIGTATISVNKVEGAKAEFFLDEEGRLCVEREDSAGETIRAESVRDLAEKCRRNAQEEEKERKAQKPPQKRPVRRRRARKEPSPAKEQEPAEPAFTTPTRTTPGEDNPRGNASEEAAPSTPVRSDQVEEEILATPPRQAAKRVPLTVLRSAPPAVAKKPKMQSTLAAWFKSKT
jgi:hypothetical protein